MDWNRNEAGASLAGAPRGDRPNPREITAPRDAAHGPAPEASRAGAGGRPDASPLSAPTFTSLWTRAAERLGWAVVRTSACYASSDGAGTLAIGIDQILDGDDAAAQLIFHELCHGLVEGPDSWTRVDWGFTECDAQIADVPAGGAGRNGGASGAEREHACLRVQFALSSPLGLSALMAPTTEYREFYARISAEPSAPEDLDVRLARAALTRPASKPWREELERALRETRAELDARAPQPRAPCAEVDAKGDDDADADAERGALAANYPRHPVGFAYGAGEKTCGDCAWIYLGGRGRAVHRCRQSAVPTDLGEGERTEPSERACLRWEPKVDCQDCGACCREAYHSVTVAVRDPVVWKHPELVVRTGPRFEIRRRGERCAALAVDAPSVAIASEGPDAATAPPHRFSCSIYPDRPRPCREFEAGGRHCLVARRRVGLSAHDDRR